MQQSAAGRGLPNALAAFQLHVLGSRCQAWCSRAAVSLWPLLLAELLMTPLLTGRGDACGCPVCAAPAALPVQPMLSAGP